MVRLQELLAADLQQTPSLEQMAAEVGLSRQGTPAGEVAHRLGFADQSHLNRHFRAAYGISPGRYQACVRT